MRLTAANSDSNRVTYVDAESQVERDHHHRVRVDVVLEITRDAERLCPVLRLEREKLARNFEGDGESQTSDRTTKGTPDASFCTFVKTSEMW